MLVLSVGLLSDKMKLWKIMVALSIIELASFLLLIACIWHPETTKVDFLFDLSFSVANGMVIPQFMLYLILLSKIVGEETRGTMFSLNGLFGSLLIVTLDGLGGYLFSHHSKKDPFILVGVINLVFIVLLFTLAFSGKIKV